MRRLDRMIALLLGLALAAAAVLAGIETMELVLGRAPLVIPRHAWDQGLRSQQWNSTDVVVTSAILAGVGALLVVLQLVRRRPVRLALRSRPGQRAWVSRKGLARRLGHDVARLDVVTSAKVRGGRRRVRARVTLASGTEPLAGIDAVRSTTGATLASLATVRDFRVRVSATLPKPDSTPPNPGGRAQ